MAARRPFWKWHRWKSIGFCLWPPSTCIWNLKLKFQSKLCSGNHVVYRQTDRRTDGRTRWIQYTSPPTSLGGGIITTQPFAVFVVIPFYIHHLGSTDTSLIHHNERDGVSNLRCLDCLFNRLFRWFVQPDMGLYDILLGTVHFICFNIYGDYEWISLDSSNQFH